MPKCYFDYKVGGLKATNAEAITGISPVKPNQLDRLRGSRALGDESILSYAGSPKFITTYSVN